MYSPVHWRPKKAENAVLVHRRALAMRERPAERRSWLPKASNNGGSMQLLVNTNAKLMMENARLQLVVDVLNEGFKTHIKASKRTIKTLRQKNVLLQKQLSVSQDAMISSSGCTAEKSSESSTMKLEELEELRGGSPTICSSVATNLQETKAWPRPIVGLVSSHCIELGGTLVSFDEVGRV
jgi:hypothetical protein